MAVRHAKLGLDTLMAVRHAKNLGLDTFGIVNVVDSTILHVKSSKTKGRFMQNLHLPIALIESRTRK